MARVPLSQLESVVGTTAGRSEPLEITQEMVDAFADATHDHQWIHVDPERAREGPFGGPVAHGFLTLSLVSHLAHQCLEVDGVGMGVNYGLNRVRFPAPVPVGSRVVAEVTPQSVADVDAGGKQIVNLVTITVEGATKPACVAEVVSRYYPAA